MSKPRIDNAATTAVKEAANTHALAEIHVSKVIHGIGSSLRTAQQEVEAMAAKLERLEQRNRELSNERDWLKRKIKRMEGQVSTGQAEKNERREVRALEQLHREAMEEKDQQIQRLQRMLQR